MSASPPGGRSRLCVCRFGPGARFEGALAGALERMEGDDRARLLDALFVGRDAAGELAAIDLATARADGSVAGLLDFRLDPARRRAATRRTLAARAGGVARPDVEAIGGALEPGGALLAVLVAGPLPTALEDAVERSGGRVAVDEPVAAGTLADVVPRLLDAT